MKPELKTISSEIDSPVSIQSSTNFLLYQSPGWADASLNKFSSKPVLYTLYGDDNVPAIIISTMYDQSQITGQFESVRFNVFVNAGISILGAILLILLILLYILKPLERVQKSLGEVLNDRFVPIMDENLPSNLVDFVSAYNQIIMVLDDATDKHAIAEKDLRAERDFISKTLNSIANSVVVLNPDLIISLVNPAFEKLLCESKENLIGYSFTQIIHMYTNHSLTHIANFEQLLRQSQQQCNLFYQVEDKVKELEMTSSPMLDVTSEDIGFVLVFKDVTEGRMLRRQLNYESRHDKLTGLLNRMAFESKFEEIINEVSHTQYQHVFVYINLDNFRVINLSCGNEAGDSLLKQVAEILQKNIRKSDLSACFGGDEYGLILPYSELENAANTVNDILATICKTGFSWKEIEYPISASASLIPFGRENDDFSEVLLRLMTANSLAKQDGGNQYYLIGDNDVKVEEHRSSLTWVARINSAFVEKRFKLYAQPIAAVEPVAINSEKQCYEILIRYQAEDGTIVSPHEFLGAAEQFQLIDKIDRWVVSEVIHWMAINPELKGKVQYFINLSARSVCSSSFYRFLQQILQTELVDAQSFCFEITEAAVVRDIDKSIQFIHKIKALGAKFSLDNFGSGVSSLTYLQKLPVDYLKIDGVCIESLLLDNDSNVFVSSIVAVGHSLGMKVIAEKVESAEVMQKLAAAKVDYYQGTAIKIPAQIETIDFKQADELLL